ncbi:MAG: MalY/PatB family protein [Bacillota bacterium]
MRYDFDQVINRNGTHTVKWDSNTVLFGREDVLDMWVADMEFPCPEPVVEAIKARAAHPIYGYTHPPASLYDAIVERMQRYYGWQIKKEWLVSTAGVVNGLYSAVEAFSHPGDEVIVQPPVYYPFYSAVRDTGRQLAYNPLRFDGQRYLMDYAGLEKMLTPKMTFPAYTPRAKALILSNPHNPVGRVWTKAELQGLGEICLKHNIVILSDEIHCDLLINGAKHQVLATLSEQLEQQTVTFMSASKTFNLAGLATSFVIIPNARLRQQFTSVRHGHNGGNLFGWAALEAAYRYGDEYLQQLRDYLTANVEYFADAVAKCIPEIKVIKPEGTYLVWVDMRSLGMDHHQLQTFIHEQARLALDDGFAFGAGGEGFQRFNLACPRSMVEEAVRRLEVAVRSLRLRP